MDLKNKMPHTHIKPSGPSQGSQFFLAQRAEQKEPSDSSFH